ncbi:NADH dehydrogenase [ubiquinone] 1 subunit C2 [Hyperolius riggenbachi]|uniref:NADH dehydrogenase [ubiquinone] 1 subunit C2 n=1 Tax=Hyperolius riggenbachi TaxID=752182 RepID=UPI0035A378CC
MTYHKVPEEGRVLPPPNLLNRGSVFFGFLGYVWAALHNAVHKYPALKAGLHRQALLTTLGVFVGYHITKYENYAYAKKDRELFDYMRRHPELFVHTEPRKIGELLEPFQPAR